MKQKMRVCFLKKKEGTNTSFVLILLGILAIFILMMMSADLTTNINRLQKVEQVGREYLLRMESDGYLTSSDQTELMSDLSALGYVSNISVTAPISEVGYGQQIELKIEYDLQVESISFIDIFNFSNDSTTMRKTFFERTTSKH